MAGVGGLVVGAALGIVFFAVLRNHKNFCWSPRNRRGDYDVTEYKDQVYDDMPRKADNWKNNYEGGPPLPRPSTPQLTKLNPTGNHPIVVKVTDSPVLSKYRQSNGHSRSHSSGGQNPVFGAYENPAYNNHHGNPNLKSTVMVEEVVTNRDRVLFGPNVVGRQMSKEFPVQSSPHHMKVGYHAKTGSLDMSQ